MMAGRISNPPLANRCRIVQLGRIDEPRGSLCVAEVGQHIPFEVQRVYWVYDVPRGGERAYHAHREQQELLVAAAGAFTVHCEAADGLCSTYRLDSPDVGLLLPPMVFHRLDDFSAGALCLVLASGPYAPSEYVNDLAEFRALAGLP
jgi:oxalate decarboxylase/phosphoglucose isomerase-like protein (cupin superfamily)